MPRSSKTPSARRALTLTTSTVNNSTTATSGPQGFVTKPASGSYHQGKDGKWYTYQELSQANRAFLQRKFQLDRLEALAAAAKQNNTQKRKKRSPSSPRTPTSSDTNSRRSSARLRLVTPENPKGMNAEDLKALEEAEKEANYRPVKRRKTGQKQVRQLTEDERQKLAHLPDWISGLHDYLTKVDPVSDQNRRNVMRQVELMASGIGVTYRHWKEGVVWMPGQKIDLTADFDELYQDAVLFERKHGRDLGNGWLMRHPLVKLKQYQAYLSENKSNKKED